MRNSLHRFSKKVIASDLNPEDLFLDSAVHNDMAVPHDTRVEDEFPFTRFRFSLLLFVGIVLVFSIYMGKLNIFEVDMYRSFAYDNAAQVYPISAPRGIIYDRTGKPLVQNIPSFDLVVVPRDIKEFKTDSAVFLKNLGIIDPARSEYVRTRWESMDFTSSLEVVLLSDLSHEDVLVMRPNMAGLRGVRIDVTATRAYPTEGNLAHTLGYTGKVTRKDLKRTSNLLITDLIGKTGIEFVYDEWLRGINGKRTIEVDARADKRRERVVREVAVGGDVVLSLDIEAQEVLSRAFQKAMDELKLTSGAGIAMDPRTGEILALVSFPGYDNNAFTQGRVQEVQATIKNPGNPLFNRAVGGAYLPGSVVKPFLALAGLEEGTITKGTTMDTGRDIRIVNQYDPRIVYRFRDSINRGRLDLTHALAFSSNLFFYALGGGHPDLGVKGLGVQKIHDYLERFGWGAPLGIDLPGEVGGLLPTAQWKERVKHESWLLGDTYNLSIGQGDITITPLQLTAGISAIANGGTLYRPHLGIRLVDKEGKNVKEIASEVLRSDIMSSEDLELVKGGMAEVVKQGTGIVMKEFAGKVAAKTGTAQFNGMLRSWFTSFTPVEQGEVVLTILLEGGTGGGVSAAPVARDFYTWYFNRAHSRERAVE